MSPRTARDDDVRAIAAEVTDPEMPMLTLADLGVLRGAERADDGTVTVTITPTYSGCPAIEAMRADLRARLHAAGLDAVEVRVSLSPPWTTDLITDEGRRKLAEAGVAPPGHIGPRATGGPVPLRLEAPAPSLRRAGQGEHADRATEERRASARLGGSPVVRCPQCDSADTEEISRFGPTACTALRRCRACREPFEHMKDL